MASRSIYGFIFILSCIFYSCASPYRTLNLHDYAFTKPEKVIDSIYVGYLTNIELLHNNGWYLRKEKKNHMVALGVKIQNYTDASFVMERAYVNVFVGNEKRKILTLEEYNGVVKQRVWPHALHSLYVLPFINTPAQYIVLPVGLGVAGLNLYKSTHGNRVHEQQIGELEIWNKRVPAHSVVYGILLIEGSNHEKYSLRFVAE